MTDPYRSVGGIPCPRCGLVLVEDDLHDLVCPDGCGRWIPATTVVPLLGTLQLASLARPVAHWKATPFPSTKCPICTIKMMEQYMTLPDGDILTHGFCTHHGAWLDRGTHDDFLVAYESAIEAHVKAIMLREETGTHAADRVEQLEARVAKLERQLEEVRTFVGGRFKWTDWNE